MLKKDSYLTGILLAIPLPIVAYVMAIYVFQNSVLLLNKPALPYMISISLNLIIMRLISTEGATKTVKGIFIATFFITITLFVFKLHLKA